MAFKKRQQQRRQKSQPQGRQVAGTLSVHRDGYGFVTPDGGGDDVFVPARYLRENLHGDKVDVEVMNAGRGGKKEGRIAATRERAVRRIVGIFRMRSSGALVQPDDERLPWLAIPPPAYGGAREGEVVVADVVSYPADRHAPTGRVVEVLGSPDDPEVELLTVIRRFELPYEFPPKVLQYAEGVSPEVTAADLSGRTDLRGLTTVTIDGESARDFDDAVSVRREGANIRLWVSIADVAHYVPPGSPLDKEAYLRGTSVYFPDRCIPMLPEKLSNGICSLNPQVDRLTLTAEMLFNSSAEMLSATFYPSVINSAARLTYTLVSRIVEHDDPEAKAGHAPLVADLLLMKELAQSLASMRSQRGSIDFDLPEAEIILGLSGAPEAILRAERNLAHKIIESFMLAANEAVASHLAEAAPATLFRVHELPDQVKLETISQFFSQLGYGELAEESTVTARTLQALLAHASGQPEERLINRMLLRSMKQARYAAENLGHFGLAAPCYTHFTSPIRRYPDLVVHRILKWLLAQKTATRGRGKLGGAPFPGYPGLLAEIGEHTSKRERVAMEAERDIVELKKVQFMAGKVGEEFAGFVNGVSQFGFFVELDEMFVEGLVHISTLPQDFYQFIENEQTLVGEKSKVRYRIGDPVRVQVAAVSKEKRQIDFVLAGVTVAGASPPAEEYLRRPVKGKKPEGWKAVGKSGGSGGERSGPGRETPRRDGGGRGGRKRR
jgi:ribonuclease R